MANIKEALKKVLHWEGGISNHPMDKGGLTAYGITQKTYSYYYEGSVRDITMDQVEAIYRTGYWNKIKGDEINSQSVAELLFDMAVNSGVRTASVTIQRLVGADADGIIGRKTLQAINSRNPQELFNAFKKKRIEFYEDIVKRSPSQKVFIKGWLNRVNSYKFNN